MVEGCLNEFVVATKGATSDGRQIPRQWLNQMTAHYDATAHGMQDTDIRADMAARYRQHARWAVCEILDRPHTTVELI